MEFESEADEGTTGPTSLIIVDPDGNPHRWSALHHALGDAYSELQTAKNRRIHDLN